jgi:hypothetical protein
MVKDVCEGKIKTSIIILQKQLNGMVKLGGMFKKKRTRHHLLVPHMLVGDWREGESFVPKKSRVSVSPFLQFLVLVLLPSFPPIITNEKKQSSKG